MLMIGRKPGSLESVQKKLHVFDYLLGIGAIAWGIYADFNPWWIGGGGICLVLAWWNPVPKFQAWLSDKFIRRPDWANRPESPPQKGYGAVTVSAQLGTEEGARDEGRGLSEGSNP